jgi:hypothetical protein
MSLAGLLITDDMNETYRSGVILHRILMVFPGIQME